ncbi:MAG: hypothetical protein AAGG02_06020 [Cyanobacteria bacterium P01_H01_bin.15]
MNAVEQARTPELAGKIAHLAYLFQREFPDASVDFSPWLSDEEAQKFLDPHSIDLSFNFPRRKSDCQSRSILVQIRFSDALLSSSAQILGIELSGYDCQGQQWRLSTVDAWSCGGPSTPTPRAEQRLKQFCQSIFRLYKKPFSPTSRSKQMAMGGAENNISVEQFTDAKTDFKPEN